MKFKMFKRRLDSIRAIIDKEEEIIQKIEDGIGCNITADWFGDIIDEQIKMLEIDCNDKTEDGCQSWVGYLIEDLMPYPKGTIKLIIDDVEYKPTVKFIWKQINNKDIYTSIDKEIK